MTSSSTRSTRARRVLIATAALIGVLAPAVPAAAASVPLMPIRQDVAPLPDCAAAGADDFTDAALDDTRWSQTIRPEAGPVEVRDGSLVLTTVSGGVDAAPLPQQVLPTGDWSATTELTFAPGGRYQQAGILLYENDERYSRVNLTYGGLGLTLEHVLHRDGTNRNAAGVDTITAPSGLGETFQVRLTSIDGTVTAYYSIDDGATFTELGRPVTDAELNPTHIGPYALKGATAAPVIDAAFGWFHLMTADEAAACGAPLIPAEPEVVWPELGEGAPLGAPQELPVFEFEGIVVDPDELAYNPTDEVIFPSVFHAGEHLADPLAEWYLYYAPHDAPGGISLMYADSLDGPWTEYDQNPLIARSWPGNYNVGHVSSPDAFWNEAEDMLFMYYHGDNNVTRYATSEDGITFEYGDAIITASDAGTTVSDVSYARVFEHPDPDSEWNYVLLYGEHHSDINSRRIRMAVSVDGRDWELTEHPLVMPGPADGRNIAAPNYWQWNGRHYVTYHSSSGTIYAREVNAQLTEVGPAQVLYVPSSGDPDNRRAASPEILTDNGTTYLFYEAGDRSVPLWVINYATATGETRALPADPRRECVADQSDAFDGDIIDAARWDRSLRWDAAGAELRDGELVVPTRVGKLATAPLLLQDPPEGDREATTALRLRALGAHQQAGIVLHGDDANTVRLTMQNRSSTLELAFVERVNGADRALPDDVIPAPPGRVDTVWLRMSQTDGVVTGSYSIDGTTFTSLGHAVDAPDDSPAVGLYALQAGTATVTDAAFEWFEMVDEASIAACEEAETPGTDEPGTEDPGTDDPGTDDPGAGDPNAGSGSDLGSDPSSGADAGNPSRDDALATTGADAAPLIAAAVLLLLMGAGVLVVARRRRV